MKTLRNIGLFFLAVALAVVFIPLGLLYSLVTLRLCPLSDYAKACAIAIDQLGNVFCSTLFNDVLIFQNPNVRFGDPDQTISAVLGYNQRDGSLTVFGFVLCWLLDTLDPRHCYKAMVRDQNQCV